MDKIYELKLHEDYTPKIGSWQVMRVAGGWIYTYFNTEPHHSIFVPFNNEFQEVGNGNEAKK